MAPYSMDLRSRVLTDCDAGVAAKDVAATGETEPRQQTVFKKHALAGQEDRLRALVDAQPDRTLAELREALPSAASLSSIWRALDRLGLTVKKTVHADEQRRPDVVASANGCRCATCGSTSFSMNAASRPICYDAMAAARAAHACGITRLAVTGRRTR